MVPVQAARHIVSSSAIPYRPCTLIYKASMTMPLSSPGSPPMQESRGDISNEWVNENFTKGFSRASSASITDNFVDCVNHPPPPTFEMGTGLGYVRL